MHLGQDSILVMLVIGAIAGWLAGVITRGSGFGIVGDVMLGLLGAFVGAWLLQALGVRVPVANPLVERGIVALIGAIFVVLLFSLLRPRTLGERMTGWWRR